jgi:hypothetical protein
MLAAATMSPHAVRGLVRSFVHTMIFSSGPGGRIAFFEQVPSAAAWFSQLKTARLLRTG